MNPRIRIQALGAAVAAAALFAAAPVAQANTTLTLSSWVPPAHFLVKDILCPGQRKSKRPPMDA